MFNFPMLSAHAPLDFIVNFPLFSIILAFVGVVVCSLVKKTGLSRAFFYNNEAVHAELQRAQELQEGKSFIAPQKLVINKAMDREIELLKKIKALEEADRASRAKSSR